MVISYVDLTYLTEKFPAWLEWLKRRQMYVREFSGIEVLLFQHLIDSTNHFQQNLNSVLLEGVIDDAERDLSLLSRTFNLIHNVNKIGLNVEHDNLPMETLIIESLSTVENIRIKNLQIEESCFNNNFIQYL
jgi:hypothetical protein